MRIDSAIITGSFSINGDTFNDLGAYTTTGSNTFVGNQSIVGAVSASALTGSISYTNLTNVPTLVSGSEQIISILSPLNSYTQSSDTLNTTQTNRLNSLEEKTGSLATTGSNIFYGNQTISGTVYIQSDLIVQGSSCIQNITGSSLNIGTNIVSLNTATPSVRYAGMTVQDSGSSAGVTGSILWDSLCNRWMYSNPSTVGYSGGIIMSGPRAATLGGEVTLTCNYIAKSGGGDHLYDSCIIDNGTTITLKSNVEVTGSLSVMGDGAVINRTSSGEPYIFFRKDGINRGSIYGIDAGGLRIFDQNDTQMLTIANGFVGIGATLPCSKLHISNGIDVCGTQFLIGQSPSWGAGSIRQVAAGVNYMGIGFTCGCAQGTEVLDAISIQRTGYVGIGYNTPCQKLHVFGAGDSTKVRFEVFGQAGINEVLQLANSANFNPGRGVKIGLYVNCCTNSSQLGAEIGATTVSGDNHGASLFFNTTYAGTSSEKMRITNTGVACFACQICASGVYADGSTSSGTVIRATQSSNADGCAMVIARWSSDSGMRMLYHPNSAVGVIENTYQISPGQIYGDILFRHNSSGTPVTRLRLQADGGIACFAGTICATQGVKFGTGASTLNHYEVGTWTPDVIRSAVNASVSYSDRAGTYVRVGNTVNLWFDFTIASISGGSGTYYIAGLPFAVSNSMAGYSRVVWRDFTAAIAATNTQPSGFVQRGDTYIYPQNDYISNGSSGFGTYSATNLQAGRITGFVTYQI